MAGIHLALVGVAVALYPIKPDVDVLEYRDTIFRDQFSAAVFGALESRFQQGAQVIIVGSSNALLAFRPPEIEALMPGVRVHNIATNSMRADEIRQLVQLAWNVMPAAERERTVFVVTLIFASFPGPHSLYSQREAGIAQAIRQSASFRQVDGDFVPRWSGHWLTAAALLRRPLELANVCVDDIARWTFGVRTFVVEMFRRHVVDVSLLSRTRPEEAMVFPRSDTADGRRVNLTFFRALLASGDPGLEQRQFDELLRLCRWAGERDTRLVLVEMPVPDWVRTGVSFFAEYREKLGPILSEVEHIPSIRFVDLHDAPLPMWDSTHPEPGNTRAWAEVLVGALRAARSDPRDLPDAPRQPPSLAAGARAPGRAQ